MTTKETKAQRKRNLYAQRVEAGICCKCGQAKAVDNYRHCQPCLDYIKSIKSQPKCKETQKNTRKTRKDEMAAIGLCYRCKEPIKIVEGNIQCLTCNEYQVDRRIQIREFVYTAYGNKCACPPCGEIRWQFLTLDHVNDDGAEHRKQEPNTSKALVEWAYKNGCPPSLRLHCWNCNNGRERNKGVCPHLTE